MTCQVILELTAKDGTYDELRKMFIDIISDTRSYEGCVSVDFVRNQDEPNQMVILEKWDSRKSYEAYFAWRTETGVLEQLGKLADGAPQLRFFDAMGV
ncbi:MAG TPA: antibiotic biosynthesis monooxygenase family protein [Pseudonocardia sp.]|jgi:quinol monooxygenase YgiN|nr:antibiotic biosynthesis monooxygenase family protein [Pseudonocardia sp.]